MTGDLVTKIRRREVASRKLNKGFISLGVLSLVLFIVRIGFNLTPVLHTWFNALSLCVVIFYGLVAIGRVVTAKSLLHHLGRNWVQAAFVAGLAIWGLAEAGLLPFAGLCRFVSEIPWLEVLLAVASLVLFHEFFVKLLHQTHEHAIRKEVRRINPLQLMVGGFALIIIVGTILLVMPKARGNPDVPISPVDALFTATSAVCVTGLTVRDTGTAFSGTGQTIILCLIQIGGLGIMTFGGFFMMLMGQGMGIGQRAVMRDVMNYDVLGRVSRMILFIITATLLIEGIGAAILYMTAPAPAPTDPGQRLWYCVFHSVAAFCNAGFGLEKNNLIPYAGNWPVNLTIMGLIIVGGLGFTALMDTIMAAFTKMRNVMFRKATLDGEGTTSRRQRLSLQSKLSLIVSGILILAGAVIIFALEYGRSLAGKGLSEKILISLFQSVTPRTAGFNTVDMATLGHATLIIIILLMFIGASPGSTGGGIKTTTAAVMLASLRSIIRNRTSVEIFQRSLPTRVVQSAMVIFMLASLVVAAGTTLLCVTDPGFTLQEAVFEVVSALGTVGLSLGITAKISVAGKLVLCAIMFFGRLGPLTMVFALMAHPQRRQYDYASENVAVG
jgi:trk system potassium uptake protein TrkH